MPIPAVSLFTGAGGLDIGAGQAGFRSAICVENDARCIETLHENKKYFGRSVLVQDDVGNVRGSDLLDILGMSRGELPLLIGGPPCQSFSKAAYWTSTGEEAKRRRDRAGVSSTRVLKRGRQRDPDTDPRSGLVDQYLRLLRELRPEAFVFENVLSILHPSNKHIFESFVRRASRTGYQVRWFRANAAEHGVPQLRDRVFVVGLPKGVQFTEPVATHSLPRNSSEFGAGLVTKVGDVIAPFAGSEYFEPAEQVVGRWEKELRQIPPGGNYKALTAWAGHPYPKFVAETRFWNFLLKLHPDLPSWTIAAQPGPWVGPFHWEGRRLRVPELAAIQGFPTGYQFEGSRRDQQRQIGNAVPPPVAKKIVKAVLKSLKLAR